VDRARGDGRVLTPAGGLVRPPANGAPIGGRRDGEAAATLCSMGTSPGQPQEPYAPYDPWPPYEEDREALLPHDPVRPDRGPLRRLGGLIVALGLGLWKLAAPLLALAKSTKLLATGFSFLASVGAYALLWGWKFGLGFTLLILVHELGHVIQFRREGVRTTPVLFLPFLGAVVGARDLPRNAWVEAKVGLAGPILGGVGAAVTYALAVALSSDLLRALAYVAFLINLFNLAPVLPLDGGRAAAALHPWFWFVGLFALAALFFAHPTPILLLILIFGGRELYHRWSRRNDPASRAYHAVTWSQRLAVTATYLVLAVLLVAGMDASYIHREL
jgi:Zn-dependent protease